MAWRKMTEDDLTAVMTQLEIDAYRKSGNWKADPVTLLLAREAARIRAYVRTNGKIVMSPDPLEVPESCIGPAMEMVAFSLCARIGKEPSEARKTANKNSVTFFESIGRRWITVESYGHAEDEVTAGPTVEIVGQEESRMENLEGL